ncbi:hypothetical protein [Nostoc commune]|uniref:hypothetical protein n=1 Tax=Nostoc commune TaxID=1178 RepID=UPI0018C57050|nr:hypothetical protein [Nostoc commune]
MNSISRLDKGFSTSTNPNAIAPPQNLNAIANQFGQQQGDSNVCCRHDNRKMG